MSVTRIRKIYYLIETAVWFWFIWVRLQWALPGRLPRVPWTQPHTFTGHSSLGMSQTYHTAFNSHTWNSALTNSVDRLHSTAFLCGWKCLQKEMCEKTLEKLSQKLDLPPRLSNELVILALYFQLLPISRRTAMLRVSNDQTFRLLL